MHEAIAEAQQGRLVTRKRAQELVEAHGAVPARKDKGKARTTGKQVQQDTLKGLRASLDAFSESIDDWAAKMTSDDRNSLADRFLEMALQLRTAGHHDQPKATTRRATRKRSKQPAAA